MPQLYLRRYHPEDRDDCVAVFNSNVPHFLADQERAEFLEYLDMPPSEYWVVDESGRVVGCGGFGPDDDSAIVSLHWGLIHSDRHGRRLGELLMLARIVKAVSAYEPLSIRVATSQHTQAFFQKYGFVAKSIKKNGFADGIDLIEMFLTITADNKSDLKRRLDHVSSTLMLIDQKDT